MFRVWGEPWWHPHVISLVLAIPVVLAIILVGRVYIRRENARKMALARRRNRRRKEQEQEQYKRWE